jgi:hypothetical protein
MKYGVAAVTQIWLAAAARIKTADCDLREYDCHGGGEVEAASGTIWRPVGL